MSIPENPTNRKERYLAKIAGQEGATIPSHPYTREERYLEVIAENSGSGLPEVTEDDNGKVLTVVEGEWAAATLPIYNGGVE